MKSAFLNGHIWKNILSNNLQGLNIKQKNIVFINSRKPFMDSSKLLDHGMKGLILFWLRLTSKKARWIPYYSSRGMVMIFYWYKSTYMISFCNLLMMKCARTLQVLWKVNLKWVGWENSVSSSNSKSNNWRNILISR